MTHTISIVDLMALSVETPRIDSGCSWDKEFIKLMYMNL